MLGRHKPWGVSKRCLCGRRMVRSTHHPRTQHHSARRCVRGTCGSINRGASHKGVVAQDGSVHASFVHTASLDTTLCARNVWSVLHKPWEVSKRSRIRRRCSVAINRGASHKGKPMLGRHEPWGVSNRSRSVRSLAADVGAQGVCNLFETPHGLCVMRNVRQRRLSTPHVPYRR